MAIKKNNFSGGGEYSVSYSGMKGVNFSADAENPDRRRFSYLENMYKDYGGLHPDTVESIPGFRIIASLPDKINSIFTHKTASGDDFLVVHSGSSLFRVPLTNTNSIIPATRMCEIKDTKSRAFVFNTYLYVLDGKNITRVSPDGVSSLVEDGTDSAPYIPTTFYNGKEYEQRNLLTDKFRERYILTASSDMATGTDGLKYTVTSMENKECAVCGIDSEYAGEVKIPSYAQIGEELYKVREVLDNAFLGNKKITRVTVGQSVERIGSLAFAECDSLFEVIIPDSVKRIEGYAFKYSPSLTRVYLGAGIEYIGSNAFAECASLLNIDYAKDGESFGKIESYFDFSVFELNFGVPYSEISIELPIFTPAKEIYSVTLGNTAIAFSPKIKDGLVGSVIITDTDKRSLDGKELEVFGIADPFRFKRSEAGTDFMSEMKSVNGKDAVLGCRVCEKFDGRIFLSGNPNLPNTVFYSARDADGKNNPTYFGTLNYFNDGTGPYTVTSLLSTADSLAVFKESDDGGGSIFYHKPMETDWNILPKVYPVSYIHNGLSALGDSISFFDDALFVSMLGITALDKEQINLERSIAVRSHNVNAKLLYEDLREISLAKWCGYLVVCAGERFYLADSRQTFIHQTGYKEYEWYYLNGIGTYDSSFLVFKYSSVAKDGYSVHPKAEEEVISYKDVYMKTAENGELVYFICENGVNYEVYHTGEKKGGNFHPARCIASLNDELLFFGTENGKVCLFNNDMRAKAPPYLQNKKGFNDEEYRAVNSQKIHPYYYSFASHAPHYRASTASDNGGVPYFAKSTVKGSLTVKLLTFDGASIDSEVGTESNGYKEIAKIPTASVDFEEVDFSRLSFSNSEYITLPLSEREKGWIEKSITLYSDKFSSPFGICTVGYRFRIKGKIKHK